MNGYRVTSGDEFFSPSRNGAVQCDHNIFRPSGPLETTGGGWGADVQEIQKMHSYHQ